MLYFIVFVCEGLLKLFVVCCLLFVQSQKYYSVYVVTLTLCLCFLEG